MNENETDQEDRTSETLDFSKPDFVFQPKEHHDWRQRGPYLVCKSCEIEHATYIGMGRLMVGLDEEGRPLLKAR